MHSQSRLHKILLVWDLKNPTLPHSPHHLSDAWTHHLWYHHSTSELQVISKLPCLSLHTTKLSEMSMVIQMERRTWRTPSCQAVTPAGRNISSVFWGIDYRDNPGWQNSLFGFFRELLEAGWDKQKAKVRCVWKRSVHKPFPRKKEATVPSRNVVRSEASKGFSWETRMA